MKKALARLAALFFYLACCFSQNSTNDIATITHFLPGQYKIISTRTPRQWQTWGRKSGSISKSISSSGVYSFSYKADSDYSISLAGEIPIAEGSVYILYAECSVAEGLVGASFITRNEKNEVIDWNSGFASVEKAKGWQTVAASVSVSSKNHDIPVTIEPRLTGYYKTSVRIRNVTLLKYDMQNVLHSSCVLRNKSLEVTVDSSDCSFTVHDKRCNKTYVQYAGDLHNALVTHSQMIDSAVVLTAIDLACGRQLHITISLSDDTVTVSLADGQTVSQQKNQMMNANAIECLHTDVLGSPYNYPGPIVLSAKEYVVLPINEGISFFATDMNMLTGDFEANYGHGMSMPFFGATDGSAGWMVVLDTSDDAGMRLEQRDGRNCVSPFWQSQCGSFGYTRRCRYIFTADGGHVAIAKRYRAIAKENGTLMTFSEKKQMRGVESAARLEKLRGAVNVWKTWQDDNAPFCKELFDAGIKRMIWSSASSPDDIQTMNNLGSVLTGKYDIYQDVMDPKNFSKVIYNSDEWVTDAFPDDIVRTKDGSLLHAWPVERKDNPQKYIDCVALCDMTAPSYARKRISQDLSNSPYAARFLDTTTASNLRECYDKRHPMTRSQSKQARITLLNIVSNEHHLVCGSETGADYAVPVCDYFEGMMSLGPYRIKDAGRNCEQIVADVPPQITTYQLGEAYRLPLWELVYHDCTVAMWYWGDYNNKMPAVWDKRDLFNTLYGVPPMFYMSKKYFEANKARFVQSYNASKDVTYSTFDTEMINHQYLTNDREVQKTEFANGVQVIVNFSNANFIWNGILIAPKSSRIILK